MKISENYVEVRLNTSGKLYMFLTGLIINTGKISCISKPAKEV